MWRAAFPCLFLLLLAGCGRTGEGDLCSAVFEPYPDLISGRVVQGVHKPLFDGMEHYTRGRYTEAIASMKEYAFDRNANKAVHLYLAMSYLATGQPYDAELHLDHLRNSHLEGFSDQVEWYTVVCWVCSGQLDRALGGARRIAARRHTYQREATALVRSLEQG